MRDILSDIFETIRLRATLYFRTDFNSPWAMKVPQYQNAARFHLVVQGRCFIRAEGQAVMLGPGDLALVPRGREHWLADEPDHEGPALEDVLTRSAFPGNGVFALGEGDPTAATQMVCGHFSFAGGADHPLLRALPNFLHITPADRARHAFLDETLRLLVRRVFEDGVGAASAVSRLSEVFFIETIRACLDRSPELARIVEGLADGPIGQALMLIHSEPAKAWTVDSLAGAVGMSRSRFAQRFSDLMGDGPMSYLADWRLQRALFWLAQPRVNVQEVATKVGYQSAAAFSRAFAAKFGAPPMEFRRLEE